MEEEWRDVVGYENYQVSNFGRIRVVVTFRGIGQDGILEPMIQNGYPAISMRGNTRHKQYVHRLVASAFMGPCPPGHIVHHRDGNRANPRIENLEYVPRGYHIHHHFVEECAALETGKLGGGMAMFDRSRGYVPE